MFKWFMAKTLITKIIIVTSSVVVIGGATAGVIIVPKVIETKKEEQRQEQIRLENEEDLANMSIKIKGEYEQTGITMPLHGVTNGITIERYDNFEKYLLNIDGYNTNYGNKEELHKELINFFVESYTGGELTVEENIDLYTRGEYPITFTVTSEKGNTKTATVKVIVINYWRVNVNVDKTDITVTKGTNVDIMEGVTFNSILPEEEQGHIETEGTVDVNTVGTYTITYRYIPKDENEGTLFEGTRTYKVIEKPNVKLNTTYTMLGYKDANATLIFKSATEFTYHATHMNGWDMGTYSGTYTVKGNKVVAKNSSWGEKYFVINNNDNTFTFDPDVYDENDGE